MFLNRARASQLMQRDGLEAIIATTAENITYSTDYFGINPYIYKDLEMYVLIPADERIEPTFVFPIDTLDYLAQRPTWIKDLRIYGTYYMYGSPDSTLTPFERVLMDMRSSLPKYPSAQDALVAALEEHQLANKRIGLDERSGPPARQEALRRRLPNATVLPCFQLFREIRAVKTPDQIETIRKAAAILESSLECGVQAILHGGTELDLWRAATTEMARQAATPTHYETTAGTRSAAGMPPSDYQLKPGDLIRLEGGCRYDWNFADTGRTLVFGEPTDQIRRMFDAIFAGQQAALELVRPGTRTYEIFDADVAAVRKAGLDYYERHHVGHGIGLEMYEAPLLTPAGKSSDIHKLGGGTVLEPNMIVNVETPYYHLGLGGFQIEDTLVVTETGHEFLTHASRPLRVLPA